MRGGFHGPGIAHSSTGRKSSHRIPRGEVGILLGVVFWKPWLAAVEFHRGCRKWGMTCIGASINAKVNVVHRGFNVVFLRGVVGVGFSPSAGRDLGCLDCQKSRQDQFFGSQSLFSQVPVRSP